MSTKKKQGFATFEPERLKEVTSKGGKAKVPKGFATVDPDIRSFNASLAAKARWAKVHAERKGQE